MSMCGMKSSARRMTQQHNEVAPSFNLWRSLNRSSYEDISEQGPGGILAMKLHPLSINVRGLNQDQKVGIIRDYLSNLMPKVDVMYLQEHKLRVTK